MIHPNPCDRCSSIARPASWVPRDADGASSFVSRGDEVGAVVAAGDHFADAGSRLCSGLRGSLQSGAAGCDKTLPGFARSLDRFLVGCIAFPGCFDGSHCRARCKRQNCRNGCNRNHEHQPHAHRRPYLLRRGGALLSEKPCANRKTHWLRDSDCVNSRGMGGGCTLGGHTRSRARAPPFLRSLRARGRAIHPLPGWIETLDCAGRSRVYWLASGASLTLITSPGRTGVSSFAAISLALPSTTRTSA